ncbi:MAG: signal recognition particle-docking protein FtsY [Nanoarchaeota archaeon]
MFDFLKKKLQSWIGTEDKKSKTGKKSRNTKQTKKISQRVPSDKQLAKISRKIKEEVPSKFEPGTLRYEPDYETIRTEQEEEASDNKEEKRGFFARLTEKFTTSKLTKEQIEIGFQELEIILLENNVALEVVDKIKADMINTLEYGEIKKGELQKKIIETLKQSISNVLHEPLQTLLEQIKVKQGPFVILFFGINGSGKTTTIAKLAHYLKQHSISCVLAAGDTFRAASIEQLETHAQRIGIPIVKSQYNADPASVAFDAIVYAKKHATKVVLIDTAGRMHTKENLMREMEKIVRISQPDLKMFIGESTTGNDATEQARTFNEAIGIDGIILSKADVDDKGGAALSISHVTGKPIYFLGTGQKMEDLVEFKKKDVIEKLGLE